MDRARIKQRLFRLLGKDPEAVVVSFLSGDPRLGEQMVAEIHRLVPDRRHFAVRVGPGPTPAIELEPGGAWKLYRQLRRWFGHYRIGLAPVLFTGGSNPLRRAAFLLAPRKILAYNARLERHHLRLRCSIASLLFVRGVPLDRIFLRPRWLCPWKRDRSVVPSGYRIVDGRPLSAGRQRVAVLTPYFPYPLSHGGAVRIFHLLREAARDFDIFLFAFTEGESDRDFAEVARFCAKLILVSKPRYREPRWSTLLPPEVHEFHSPAMYAALEKFRSEFQIALTQVEYTHLAPYGGDILVEHDVTFDLFAQILQRERSLGAWWNYFRWRRFETRMVRPQRRTVVMSQKDRKLLEQTSPSVVVIENGVDLARFHPQPEQPGQRLLFIGSFRHFPNILAYRFLVDQVWPQLRFQFPEMTVTVVCGPDHLLHWRSFTGKLHPPEDSRIRLLGFIEDVRPLYAASNLVLVPTTVSAGTNVKVLEAMAMQRAVISTSSGCAGLGLKHATNVWIADTAFDFAEGIAFLIQHSDARTRLARAARLHAEQHFGWEALGEKQRRLWQELLGQDQSGPDCSEEASGAA